ncbi:MAG: flagellar M-ring protein FliF [Rhodospirillaceae bacterium]|nr:flagellar M-ring protein FliF [Rhodospirillaceae bacterium]MBT5245577.1 flagellar M-ring protein FliF [Rhodospirillaceae bacterium]MBT5561059.1 flagellar M-ring protein FliF [Rhodospirillaceae bacterium]MBT6240695.1 flagellar M-ring protein FliF [Rhodospirillaceae bacterium]
METLIQALRNLGPLRMAVMGVVAVGLIGFFIFITTRLTAPQMELLYGGLQAEHQSKITGQLSASNTPYEIRNGNEIFAPADMIGQLRLSMAGQGIGGGQIVGYEIFDNANALGTTNFIQNVNLLRALEGELSRTIKSISSVSSARVHLVLPKRQLFSRQTQQPSATIMLKMNGARLDPEQVSAVQYLVAAAVPGLVPNRISIIDNKGSLLARGFEDLSAPGATAAKGEERKRALQRRLGSTIEQLLENIVGFGKARAEVTADMDFDRIVTNEELFDPDGQVVASTQSVEQSNTNQESDAATPVSVATNLPDANLNSTTSGASLNSNENRTEEIVNYSNSKKVINHIREAGVITRLSVAVLIDGTYPEDENGDKNYQPRNEAEMELMATLVRSAIGFNADRGDSVDVINMQFADLGAVEEEELQLFFGLNKNDLLRMAEILVLSIVAILVILLVVRPLVSRAFEALPAAMAEGRMLADQTSAAAAAALTAPSAGGPSPSEAPGMAEQYEELIDIDRVEGRVKASSVKKVGEIVEKHPEEALSIIRTWMYQES